MPAFRVEHRADSATDDRQRDRRCDPARAIDANIAAGAVMLGEDELAEIERITTPGR